MFDSDLSYLLEKAEQFAYTNFHEYLTSEHVLFVLINLNEESRDILKSAGLSDVEGLKNDLKNYLLQTNEQVARHKQPRMTLLLEQIFKELNAELKDKNIGIRDLLFKIAARGDTYGAKILEFYEVDPQKIKHGNKPHAEDKFQNLSKFSLNLTKLAAQGKIDPIIGRENELARLMQTLSRRKKNNPLLVGEAGVGKTAIVEGLALKIANGEAPEKLKGAQIFALDLGAMLAGTKYRGDFEKRLKDVMDEVAEQEDAIVFIDEIHTIVGAGATGGGGLDMSNLLKPALAGGSLRCIGATTYSEFRSSFEKEKALSRRFAKIDVVEPNADESIEILKGLRAKYESFHGVKFSDEILAKSVELAKKYLTDRFLPDSAIDLIDEVGAALALKGKNKVVKKADLSAVLSKSANIPDTNLTAGDTANLKNLAQRLKSEIFGQDEAVDTLVAAIKRSYAGLKQPNTPVGVFLFTGPSGVGKSELSAALARNLGVHFERFDMSEYMEKHSVSRLIGAPPGYVGFEEGGILTNAVKKHPYSVILFDEIEKADDDMINVFLQIFDNASLTDNTGAKSDFRNAVVIMSSNLGSKEAPTLGFSKDESGKSGSAVKGFFSPEFRNRIDKIVHFNDLGEDALSLIAQKIINEINSTLAEKKVVLKASAEAKKYLWQKGYSKEFGARNLKRLVQDEISTKLSDEILFGALKNGGVANITLKNGELAFKFEAIK
ncbi:AAA family ATPase [Campylobacter rectus]|uniref:AAA family ATPase n=1 Tax=Campylobacter rectus TaxID=203 RepID=UPI000F5D8918|nr:AAA family ATPase [Campylobacter rectus]RRD54975.1 AAA family ATPase [Campylobacter rectus]